MDRVKDVIRRAGFTLLLGCLVLPMAAVAAPTEYALDYRVEIDPAAKTAGVSVSIGKGVGAVKRIRFRIDADRHRDFSGDGKVKLSKRYVYWYPEKRGDALAYTVSLTSQRRSGAFDGMVADDWAIFRGDDLVPTASVRTSKGALANARLRFVGPDDWSLVGPYEDHSDDGYLIVNPDRRFDRPVGWFAAGKLGVRREQIAGMEVAVAGPTGQGLRRMDMLAFMNWNLPALLQVVESDCKVFVIVSAADPMWRGGLSGPCSLYVHRDRPLISENGTSTLMHEVFHSLTGMRAVDDDDWIVEGLAEFYSIELMRRTGTLSAERSRQAMEALQDWGKDVRHLPRKRSHGPITARAVLLLARLDQEIAQHSGQEKSLDDVVAILQRNPGVSLEGLRAAVQALLGKPSDALADRELLRR